MLQSIRRRWLLAAVAALALAGGLVFLMVRTGMRPAGHEEPELAASQEAPADLQKVRERWTYGVAALQRDDGSDAVHHLSSFTFGSRPVEDYRLYYLANGHQLAGNPGAARATLAKLWRRTPRLIYANDVAYNLAELYASAGDWIHAAQVLITFARNSEVPAVAASARWRAVSARLNAGDVSGAFFSARQIVIHQPASAEAADAEALVRALSSLEKDATLPLTHSERFERATALSDAGQPARALAELESLEKVSAGNRSGIRLQKGIALFRLRRFEESNKQLEPLTSGPYKIAIPALRHAARNYGTLAASIDPNIVKTVKERKRVGSVKVKVGKGKKRRTVTKPKYQTVFRKVTLVDLAKKQKKEAAERLASERLRDMLTLPLDDDLRVETLNALIVRAQAKNQDEYLRELVAKLVAVEPNADPALQYFWDKAWAAWTRGDLKTATPLFQFIAGTYRHPNVRRQAEYWYARSAERQGQREEAKKVYQKLADAPYADVYAIHAASHGARREESHSNPLEKSGPDWKELAEANMPAELRIAYELTALSSLREAFAEIRRNMSRSNARFAEALLAEFYQSTGNELLMYRSLRKAWPQLATVEQDTVPVFFLKMYYPLKYGDEIKAAAADNGLDPNLVRALILQESYYNPEAKSPVGATGLMQLMPATAKDHARRLGIAFATARLDNPAINIRLGTFHLRMLLGLFQGNTSLAVASYNAGQGNVMKWRRAAPKRPLDEFIESIPFQETRNYVKRVTMLRSTYKRLTG